MRHLFLLTIASLAFAGLTIFLGYFVQRGDFQTFITAYAAFFGLYVWVVFYLQKLVSPKQTRFLIWLGIGLRALLLFSIPNLSDDYARFLWDGHLTLAGIHPFAHPPSYFIESQMLPPGITPALFAKLNSPEYFTVYPPVCQAVFALAAWVFPSSELGGVFVMKLFLLACEIGTIRLLGRLEHRSAQAPPIPPNSSLLTNLLGGIGSTGALRCSLIYALNPLLIFEICGNCHFEGAMIFFLLTGMAALQRGAVAKGAIWWALATASKMLPIMFLPIVWRWLGWKKGLGFIAIFAIGFLILFAPLLAVFPNIMESLDLYFRQFQFNASIYYLVREIGFLKLGWDIGEFSGPVLGGLTVLGVLVIAWWVKGSTAFMPSGSAPFTAQKEAHRRGVNASFPDGINAVLPTAVLFALFLYLSLSATVQPWYITVLIPMAIMTKWKFPIVWSGLAALSYSHYANEGFQENYGLIILEYAVLWGFFLWELWRNFMIKPAQNSS